MAKNRISTELALKDSMSNPLVTIARHANALAGKFDDLGRAANDAMKSGHFREVSDDIEKAASSQQHFNAQLGQGQKIADALVGKVKGLVLAYGGFQGAKKVVELSDSMTNVRSRLNMMNDGLQTTDELLGKIYQSAQRSRGSFFDVADAVSKMGLQAGDAFRSADEVVRFTEQVQKHFAVAGTDPGGQSAALLQMTQALGMGKLRAEEFNSILEQAPNIIETIADYLEVPKGQLKDLVSDGQVASRDIVEALLSATDKTNSEFSKMGATFAQTMTKIKNSALMAFEPLLRSLNDAFNSPAFQSFIDMVIRGIQAVAGALSFIIDAVSAIGQAIATAWSYIWPIGDAVLALAAWYLAVLTSIKVEEGAAAAAAWIHAAAMDGLALATGKAATAMKALSTASKANLITGAVVAGVTALAAGIKHSTSAWAESEGMAFSWSAAWQGALASVKQLIEHFPEYLSNLEAKASEAIGDTVARFMEGAADLVDSNSELIDNVITMLEDIAFGAAMLWHKLTEGCLYFVSGAATILSKIIDVFKYIAAVGEFIFNNFWTILKNGFSAVAQGIVTIFEQMLNGIINLVEQAINSFVDMINSFISGNPLLSKAVGALQNVAGRRVGGGGTSGGGGASGSWEDSRKGWEKLLDKSAPTFSPEAERALAHINGEYTLDNLVDPAHPGAKFTPFEGVDFSSAKEAVTGVADTIRGDFKSLAGEIKGDFPSFGDFWGSTDLVGDLGIQDAIDNLKAPNRADFDFGSADAIAKGLRSGAAAVRDFTKLGENDLRDLPSLTEVYRDAYRKAWNEANGRDPSAKLPPEELNRLDDILDNLGDAAGSGKKIAGNTGKMAKDLELGSEELKYLRDIAEREVVTRFTTAEVKIEQVNNNNIDGELDLDGVTMKLTEGLREAMAIAVEGAY